MGDVVDFVVKPKQFKRQYKQHPLTVTYVPATKKWSWEIEIVQVTRIGGEADTQIKAVRAAEKRIDEVLRMQGKEKAG